MPRKRMIAPSFWRDEKIGECSFMERLLFEGLWTFAEDSGVGRASPLLIKADIFPYDTLREADINNGLAKLASLGLIQLYEIGGQRYYFVTNFSKHQTINRPSPLTLPLPLTEHSLSTHGALTPKDNISKEEDKLSKSIDSVREEDFEAFWKAYPKKVGKDAAKKSFAKIKVDLSVLLEAIEKQKKSEQWTKDNGQYIPNPVTWLNQGRWEDELPEAKQSSKMQTAANYTPPSNKSGIPETERMKKIWNQVKGKAGDDET